MDPRAEQRWTGYAVSVLAFSAVSILALWLLLIAQELLPLSQGRSMNLDTALNTAISFVTNTNWQSYAGEAGTGYLVQATGLTVQNFLSAGVGLAVAIAVVRGLARADTDRLGNFWVDLTRGTLRLLLPLAAVAAILLVAGGVVQNLIEPTVITTIGGGHQVLQGGLVASQEAIKELGTNGGGFFNANSAHPFENPTGWTNLFQIVLLLAIPSAMPYTYGLLVKDRRQGFALAGAMAVLAIATMALLTASEVAGGSLEGKEQRFGTGWSAIFAAATTGTSTGAGVPVDEQERIFQPFQRRGDAPRGDGVGLGLAVARGLTEAMGGQVGAEPTPGGGLTLVVTLPCGPAPDRAAEDGAGR